MKKKQQKQHKQTTNHNNNNKLLILKGQHKTCFQSKPLYGLLVRFPLVLECVETHWDQTSRPFSFIILYLSVAWERGLPWNSAQVVCCPVKISVLLNFLSVWITNLQRETGSADTCQPRARLPVSLVLVFQSASCSSSSQPRARLPVSLVLVVQSASCSSSSQDQKKPTDSRPISFLFLILHLLPLGIATIIIVIVLLLLTDEYCSCPCRRPSSRLCGKLATPSLLGLCTPKRDGHRQVCSLFVQ